MIRTHLTRITLAAAFVAAVPAVALAQSGSAGSSAARDSARGRMEGESGRTTSQTPRMHRGGSARGSARGGTSGGMHGAMGLSSDQVMQVQQQLTAIGCDAGTADGRVGPKTHAAMQCAARKNNVSSGNVNELLRSMNLTFTVRDSMMGDHTSGGRGGMRGGAHDDMHRGMKGGMRDSSGAGGMRDSSQSGTRPPRR